MPVSRSDIAVDFKTATLAISLMPCRAQAVFGPASEGSRAVTRPLFKFVPHHEHDASKFIPKITKCLASDSATLAVVCAKGSKQRNRNERTDKEKLAPAYFKIITGKTLGATQVWKSSWLEGPTITGADSVFCKQN